MPTLPTYTKCSELGCKEHRVGRGAFCSLHRSKRYDSEQRLESQQQYKSAYWKATKKSQLSKQPLCQACLLRGVVCQAEHVDHLFPWRQVGEQAFKRNIYQSLCTHCHSHKTQLEQRGVIEWYTHKEIKSYAVNDYAYVVGVLQEDIA